MRRRDFITYGGAGLLAAGLLNEHAERTAEAQAAAGYSYDLELAEVYEEMIDGEVLYALACRDQLTRAVRPVLKVVEGSTVSLKMTNRTRIARRFAVTGYGDDYFPAIPPGGTANMQFVAPQAGTYLYHDNSEGAAGRVAGMHSVLIVLPADGRTPAGTHTPYTSPTTAQCALFDAFGTARFPGDKWRHDLPERSFVWLFNSVDPVLARSLEMGKPVDPKTFLHTYHPRYFTLNGLSGYDAAHDKATTPKGYVGEPVLIRSANAGLCAHGPHIHGNHIFRLSSTSPSGAIIKNTSISEVDSWTVKPMGRADVLLPFIKPDEIPEKAWPPRQEKFPLSYPMHCHMEMSQTARGGQYPQGLITHWELLGVRRGATS